MNYRSRPHKLNTHYWLGLIKNAAMPREVKTLLYTLLNYVDFRSGKGGRVSKDQLASDMSYSHSRYVDNAIALAVNLRVLRVHKSRGGRTRTNVYDIDLLALEGLNSYTQTLHAESEHGAQDPGFLDTETGHKPTRNPLRHMGALKDKDNENQPQTLKDTAPSTERILRKRQLSVLQIKKLNEQCRPGLDELVVQIEDDLACRDSYGEAYLNLVAAKFNQCTC